MTKALSVLARRVADALRDLAPIILVIAFFQIVVLQQPFPNLGSILVGLVCVIAGLTLFIQGLESGLFPLGEAIAQAFARKGSATALLGFAFCLGFGTTVAEPALIAVAVEAAEVASEAGAIADDERARTDYAFALRMVVAFSVGVAIVIGVLRILKGWPIHRLIIAGYVLVTIMTVFAPDEIIGVAYMVVIVQTFGSATSCGPRFTPSRGSRRCRRRWRSCAGTVSARSSSPGATPTTSSA